MSIENLLVNAAERLRQAGTDSPKREARLLLAAATGMAAQALIGTRREPAHDEILRFETLLARRIAREPLAYITGSKEFWSLDFAVGRGVLVPRPETETLIEAAIKVVPDKTVPLAIADFGTGSGALLVAALTEFPNAVGQGFEKSSGAFGYANTNLARHHLEHRAKIVAADWEQAPDDGFDVIFSNPPYIPSAEIEALAPEIRLYEPPAALNGGRDGLDAYRSLSAVLPRALSPGGMAFVELGLGQAHSVEPLFQKLTVLHVAPDLAGIPRVLVLKKPKIGLGNQTGDD